LAQLRPAFASFFGFKPRVALAPNPRVSIIRAPCHHFNFRDGQAAMDGVILGAVAFEGKLHPLRLEKALCTARRAVIGLKGLVSRLISVENFSVVFIPRALISFQLLAVLLGLCHTP
jgi:hypothetical protein